MSVVISEFEVVPEQRREASASAPAPAAAKPSAAQLRHDVEATLRLIAARSDRLRAD